MKGRTRTGRSRVSLRAMSGNLVTARGAARRRCAVARPPTARPPTMAPLLEHHALGPRRAAGFQREASRSRTICSASSNEFFVAEPPVKKGPARCLRCGDRSR